MNDDMPETGKAAKVLGGCFAATMLLALAIPACFCLLKYVVQCWRLIDPLG